jgi:SAM-dependent methyltransferase
MTLHHLSQPHIRPTALPVRPVRGNDTPEGLRDQLHSVTVRDMELGPNEELAVTMAVRAQDDSLAIDASILQGLLHMPLEKPGQVYQRIGTKVIVGLLALWMCVCAWAWRLTVGLSKFRTDKIHWGLGPIGGSIFFDRIHWLSRQIRRGVTTSEALDATYAAPIKLASPKGWRDRIARFWFWQPDASSVRNRLRITFVQMLAELEAQWDVGRTSFRMLSLACGSAQASIEVLAEFLERHPSANVTLTLVDLSDPSLRRAANLARARGVASHLIIRHENLRGFLADQLQGTWDIVEMVGFLDYRQESSICRLTRGIRQALRPGGLFVGAHIAPAGIWSFVTAQVHRWHFMVRRTADHYQRLLHEGGFEQDEVELVVEPHGIHTVSLCRKQTM